MRQLVPAFLPYNGKKRHSHQAEFSYRTQVTPVPALCKFPIAPPSKNQS